MWEGRFRAYSSCSESITVPGTELVTWMNCAFVGPCVGALYAEVLLLPLHTCTRLVALTAGVCVCKTRAGGTANTRSRQYRCTMSPESTV